MLLYEDPAKLIHDTKSNFSIGQDRDAISRISDSLRDLSQARALRLQEAESALHKLSRQLNTLQTTHNESLAASTATQHADAIMRLDTEKFRVAKNVSDLEASGARLEQQLAAHQSHLAELEAQGVEGGAVERGRRELEDETVLKLKVYRSLGIDLESDGKGAFSKAIIRRNARGVRGDVHVVNVEERFSRFFYANYFWSTM